MLKPLSLLVGASILALAFPAAFERYRAEMSSAAEEVPPAPSAREASAPRPPAPARLVRIAAGADGHFRADALLNGRRTPVLVDTGATYVALGETEARRLGLRVAPGDFRHEARTANGATRAARTTIGRLQLGTLDLRDVEAMVLRGEGPGQVLLGMSFLGRLGGVTMRDGSLELRP